MNLIICLVRYRFIEHSNQKWDKGLFFIYIYIYKMKIQEFKNMLLPLHIVHGLLSFLFLSIFLFIDIQYIKGNKLSF